MFLTEGKCNTILLNKKYFHMKNMLIHFIFTLFHRHTPNFCLSLNRFLVVTYTLIIYEENNYCH